MIFFDMDGVLVDHMAGACEWTGKTLAELVTPGQWEVPGVDWVSLPLAFWACLPKTKDFLSTYNYGRRLCSDYYILTTVVSDDCYEGKMLWIAHHIPEMVNRVIVTEHKHLLAAPGRILCDDRDENIIEWAKAGGEGRLIPRLWNSGHLAIQSQS